MRSLISLVHPSLTEARLVRHALPANEGDVAADEALSSNAALIQRTAVVPAGSDHVETTGAAGSSPRLIVLPVRRRGRLAAFEGLSAALNRHAPEAIHYHGDPSGLLAAQLVHYCRRAKGRCLLAIELEHSAMQAPPRLWRTLETVALRAADVVIARHQDGLSVARSRGFDGVGVVSAARVDSTELPARSLARTRLGLAAPACPVFGFTAPLQEGCGIVELIEAVAACDAELVLLVSGDGPLRGEIMARASALDVEHRFHLLPPTSGQDLSRQPDMLAAMDALLVLPVPSMACDAPFDRMIAVAQAHAIPVVCSTVSGLIEVTGAGGWVLPAGDAGSLFALLRDLAQQPSRLDAPRNLALQQAARRAGAQADAGQVLSSAAAQLPRQTRLALPDGAYGSKLRP